MDQLGYEGEMCQEEGKGYLGREAECQCQFHSQHTAVLPSSLGLWWGEGQRGDKPGFGVRCVFVSQTSSNVLETQRGSLLFGHSVRSDACNPMDCSLPGSSVHGITEARILEWAAISFSRKSSQPRDQTSISCIGKWILQHWATWETL